MLAAIALLGAAFGIALWMLKPANRVQARHALSESQAPSVDPASLHETVAATESSAGEPFGQKLDEDDLVMQANAGTLANLETFSTLHTDPSTLPPLVVLENLRTVFRQFHSRFGGNPVGTNLEITRTLNGDNPGRTIFLNSEDGMQVNERGELVDQWGTPFFFHQLSRTEMEIHSAGPDRRLGTSDDLVLR